MRSADRCGIRMSGDHWCTFDHGHSGDHSRGPLSAGDEEFAQFVFHHFGGWWLRIDPSIRHPVAKLPKRISDRVTELAREYELKRGGP